MGQKANPISVRLALNKNWTSKWFRSNNFASSLLEDLKLRKAIEDRLGRQAGIERIEIRRDAREIKLTIFSSKPGIIIGRSGKGISDLDQYLQNQITLWTNDVAKSKKSPKLKIEIMEIREPELQARLVAQNIAQQLERRVAHRRAIKQAISKTMQNRRALGIKAVVAGRLGGAEIARRERFVEGQVPVSTFKANINYAQENAYTTFGTIGIKIWIFAKEASEKGVKPNIVNQGNKYVNA